MQKFKDKTGQSWEIDLPFGEVLRVKQDSSGKFNLLDTDALPQVITNDEAEFWELLWYVVQPQATDRDIDAAKFGKLMAADCLHDARQKFMEEWRDFFRQLHRPDRAAVVEKTGNYLTKAIELVTAKLASPELATLDQLAEQKMQTSLNNSFGKLLATLESTPAASPGDSSTG